MSEIASATPAGVVRRPRAVLALAAIAVLAVATGFGAYALTRGEPTHVDSIGCYSAASTRADVAVIGNTASDPVAACAELWRRGDIAAGVTAAPALQPCVLDTGAVAVIPAAALDACNRIGAARLSEQGRLELRRLGAVQAALVDRFAGDCVGEQRARAIAEQELRRAGLAGWGVTVVGTFAPGRPCASPTIDRERRSVVLVAASR